MILDSPVWTPSDLELKVKLLYQTPCFSRLQRPATDPASNNAMALQQLADYALRFVHDRASHVTASGISKSALLTKIP